MRLTNRAGPVGLMVAIALAVAVPLAAGAERAVTYGSALTLSGNVPTEAAGEPVLIFARAHGQAKFGRVATVETRAGGRWSYKARPVIRTSYLAVWGETTSSPVEVAVSPFLDLTLQKGVLSVRARTRRPLSGRYVLLQLRRPGGTWRGVRRLVLNTASRAQAPFAAPRGRSELRLFMPAAQAGRGYDAGHSAVLDYRNNA